MKRIWLTFVGTIASFALVFLVLLTPDTELTLMQAKYGGPESRYVETASGLSVHYRDQGCQTCPAIVLIHGSNSSLHTFAPLVDRLAVRYRLISYDQPGHGLTGPHPQDEYSAIRMFEALNAVVGAADIDKFAIAGSSMGGWVAWRYALENPHRVSALVLIGASGAPPRSPDAEPRPYLGARIMKSSVGRWIGQRVTPRFLVARSLLDSVADPDSATDEMIDRYWELLQLPGNRRAAGQLAVMEREPEFGERLGELKPHTLILWGNKDDVVPVANAMTFHEEIQASKLKILEGVGHLPMEEAPDLTASAINKFMQEQ